MQIKTSLEVEPRRRGRVTLLVLRILSLLWFVQAGVQIVLAAAFIGGDIAAIEAHSVNGGTMVLLPLAMTAVSLVHAVGTRRWWLPVLCLALFLLTGFQIGAGHGRVIGVHIALGAALLTIAALIAVTLWRIGRSR